MLPQKGGTMFSTMYVDDYTVLDVSYLIHAFPLNPCAEHPTDPEEWLIAALLHVGKKAHRATLSYPTRQLRDKAFEAIGAMVNPLPCPVDEEE
jgi:hypothetical protein